MRDVVVGVLLVAGTALVVFGCLGVALMREALDRLHFGGPAGYGAALLALAVLVRSGWSLIGLRALVVAVLLMVTTPVLAHATARAIHAGSTESDP